MYSLKVAAVLVPVFLSQALPSMAAGLHVPRGESAGLISSLLRRPKDVRSVAHDIQIRQTTCPAGSYECSDGTFLLALPNILNRNEHSVSLSSRGGLLRYRL
jgi:hypothetical protein